jgi:hypothetical protein
MAGKLDFTAEADPRVGAAWFLLPFHPGCLTTAGFLLPRLVSLALPRTF